MSKIYYFQLIYIQFHFCLVTEDETAASSGSVGSGSGGTVQFDDLVTSGCEEPAQDDQDNKPGPYKCTVCIVKKIV